MSTSVINTNSHTAVLTGMSYLDVDRIVASLTLASVLANKENQDIDVSLGFALKENTVKQLVSERTNVNMVEDISLASRAVELNNLLDEVGDVKWEKTSNGVKLQMFNLNGEAIDPSQASLNFSSGKYTSVYLLGVRSEKYLLKLLTNTTSADLKRVALTSINVVPKEESAFTADEFLYEGLNSFCAGVFEFCKQKGFDLAQEQLTDLLAGIYWKTNFMRNYFTTPKLATSVSSLLAGGADNGEAAAKINVLDPVIKEQVWEKKPRIEVTPKVTFAIYADNGNYETLFNQQLSPVLSPLFYLEKGLSIALLPIDAKTTYAIATNVDGDTNLSKLLRDFSPKGDDQQVKIMLNLSVDEAKQKLLDTIAPQSKPAAVEPPKPEPASVTIEEKPVENPIPVVVPEQEPVPETVQSTTAIQPRPEPIPAPEPEKVTEQAEKSAQPQVQQESVIQTTPAADSPVSLANELKPAVSDAGSGSDASPASDDDPLAPAKIDFREILNDGEDEEDSNPLGAGSLFGFGAGAGSSDPLPKAKSPSNQS